MDSRLLVVHRTCFWRSPPWGAHTAEREPARTHASRSAYGLVLPSSRRWQWVHYDELVRLTDSPVTRLNRAVVVGEADKPAGRAALAGHYTASLDETQASIFAAIESCCATSARRPNSY